jgi:outer membrane lipoprotein SlyB
MVVAKSGRWSLALILPLLLSGGLAACEQSNAVQPGVVNSAYGGYRGEGGRIVGIREVPVRARSSGVSDGTVVGGGLGAAGGAAIGAATTNSVGGAVVGAILGGVGGAIAGTAIDQNTSKRGIEVTVQKDDGQRVTVAQVDDGDVQMGDRAIIVYDRNGVAKVVRDTGYRHD